MKGENAEGSWKMFFIRSLVTFFNGMQTFGGGTLILSTSASKYVDGVCAIYWYRVRYRVSQVRYQPIVFPSFFVII